MRKCMPRILIDFIQSFRISYVKVTLNFLRSGHGMPELGQQKMRTLLAIIRNTTYALHLVKDPYGFY